jgi:threonine aldolase
MHWCLDYGTVAIRSCNLSGANAAQGKVIMHFASDNTASIAPDILQAIVSGNGGFALGYGNDGVTHRVERRIAEIFEHDVGVFLVPTGTAANALALAHVSPPWGAVFAHSEAHILTDECGAPEFFGGGLKLVGMEGVGCKVTPDTLASCLSHYLGHSPHQVVPSAFSLAQASEAGTIYRPSEIAALAKIAHAHGMKVHMDGARFANALVRMNAGPAEVTWKAGVDVLSLGATKGGALAAEAVVFFDRKRAGHLLSKHRFLALQFEAFLGNDYWLRLARHANAMADRLAAGLAAAGYPPVWPVEANLVFVVLPKDAAVRLKAAGAQYYIRNSASLPDRTVLRPDQCLVRLVASFATREEEVDLFVKLASSTQ